ncbi:hypothetical protein MMC29_006282 [Sticta canariensis]|nr:hypothetical protein [Sticta canariensis]
MALHEHSPDRVSQVSSCGPATNRESTLDAAESRPAVSVGDTKDLLEAPKTSVSSISEAAADSLNSQPVTEHTVEKPAEQPVRPTDEEILAQENEIRSLALSLQACISFSLLHFPSFNTALLVLLQAFASSVAVQSLKAEIFQIACCACNLQLQRSGYRLLSLLLYCRAGKLWRNYRRW